MFNPELVDQAEGAAQISRRSFLLGAAGVIGGFLAVDFGLLPEEARAEEWIYAARKPWQDKNWFPFDSEVANQRGIVTIDRSLAIYDKLQWGLLGQDSNLQIEFRDFADGYLNRFRGTRDWTGFCHGLAHLNLGPQPSVKPKTYILSNGEEVTVTYNDRLGMGVAWESGDLMDRPFLGDNEKISSTKLVQENLDRFIEDFITTGEPFVINAPKVGERGSWYRVVEAVSADRLKLRATNLGNGWIMIPRSGVKEVYRPVHRQSARASEVDPRLLQEIPDDWRFDNRMDGTLFGQIYAGEDAN